MKKTDKAHYFIKSLLTFFSEKKCPYCGSRKNTLIDRKYLITTLLECNQCKLMFRHPLDTGKFNTKFYNSQYNQNGITTDLPTVKELDQYLQNKFSDTNRSIKQIQEMLTPIIGGLKGKKILDYGCSWGYTTWQFKDLGMFATGFEISKARAFFGEKNLNLTIHTDTKDITEGPFDIIFSSHVIEHLPDINTFLRFCFDNLAQNGYLILLSPNGSDDFKIKNPQIFHRFWGLVHPNMISTDFYRHIFRNHFYYISSCPYNVSNFKNWNQAEQITELNNGEELLCIVKKI